MSVYFKVFSSSSTGRPVALREPDPCHPHSRENRRKGVTIWSCFTMGPGPIWTPGQGETREMS